MSGADAPSDEGELHPGNCRPLMSEQRAQRIRRWHEGAYCRAKASAGGRQMCRCPTRLTPRASVVPGFRRSRVLAQQRGGSRPTRHGFHRRHTAATPPTGPPHQHRRPSHITRLPPWWPAIEPAHGITAGPEPAIPLPHARISIPASSAPNSGPGTMSTRPSGINCRTITAETLQAGSDSLGRHEPD